MLQTLLRPGQTERVEAALAALDEHERGDPEMRATLASLRLAQHDPQAATAALAPVIDGSVGSQPFSVVVALLLEAAARDALRDPATAGRALERALDLAEPNSVLMAFLIHPAPSCSSAIPGSAPRAPSLIAGVLSLLAATSRLAAPPGEPQRLREPISQAEVHVLRYLPTNSPRQRSPANSTCRRTLSRRTCVTCTRSSARVAAGRPSSRPARSACSHLPREGPR
jgi:LuxR family transcriptional regulator, maltose regulon positive regulatory protein